MDALELPEAPGLKQFSKAIQERHSKIAGSGTFWQVRNRTGFWPDKGIGECVRAGVYAWVSTTNQQTNGERRAPGSRTPTKKSPDVARAIFYTVEILCFRGRKT